MANRKISQFNTETDITKIEGLAGYDNSITNIQISGDQLVTSLNENLFKPYGSDDQVLTLVNGAPAWADAGTSTGGTIEINSLGDFSKLDIDTDDFDLDPVTGTSTIQLSLKTPATDFTLQKVFDNSALTGNIVASVPAPFTTTTSSVSFSTPNNGSITLDADGDISILSNGDLEIATATQTYVQLSGADTIISAADDLLLIGDNAILRANGNNRPAKIESLTGEVEISATAATNGNVKVGAGNDVIITSENIFSVDSENEISLECDNKMLIGNNGGGTIEILSTGTGTPTVGQVLKATDTSGDVQWEDVGISKTPQTLTTLSPTWDYLDGYNARFVMGSGPNTLTISNTEDGDSGTIIITTSSSGTMVWPTGSKWAGGSPPALTSGGIDVFSFIKSGSEYFWSFGQDFS